MGWMQPSDISGSTTDVKLKLCMLVQCCGALMPTGTVTVDNRYSTCSFSASLDSANYFTISF